jgi:hypothetical protein
MSSRFLPTRTATLALAATSVPPLPPIKPVAGEGLFFLSLSFSLVLHPALAELLLPQVHVLDASRSSYPVCQSAALTAVADLHHRNFFLAGKLIFSVSGW